MKNENLLESTAYTKYSDWKGVISIDNNDLSDIHQLCQSNGIDMDKYFIVGFGLDDENTRGISESKNATVSVLLLDKRKYGDSADSIINNMRGESKIDVIRKTFHASYYEVGKAIKRLSFMTLWKTRDELPEITITKEDCHF